VLRSQFNSCRTLVAAIAVGIDSWPIGAAQCEPDADLMFSVIAASAGGAGGSLHPCDSMRTKGSGARARRANFIEATSVQPRIYRTRTFSVEQTRARARRSVPNALIQSSKPG
jgi:hypothetical protein